MRLKLYAADEFRIRYAVFEGYNRGYVVGERERLDEPWTWMARDVSYVALGEPEGYASRQAAAEAVLKGRRVVVGIADGGGVKSVAI